MTDMDYLITFMILFFAGHLLAVLMLRFSKW